MRGWSSALAAIGGLFGAAGVALAAYASHRGGGDTLMTAALFLILHATPLVAIGLAPATRLLLSAGSLLAVGALLFSGDLTLRIVAGIIPWHMAAPTGGTLLILGWVLLAVAGAAAARRRAG